MPRIPLYNQGQGATTRMATGALSPRANVGAFTAPGQAQARLASQAGQIAFQFGMAEKRAETEEKSLKVATATNQAMMNFTNASEATTVAQYQNDAKNFRDQLKLDKNIDLPSLKNQLTRNQYRAVEAEFEKAFATKLAQGTQTVFRKQQKIRADQVNTSIEDTMSQLRSLDPSSDMYQQLQRNLDDGFERWSSQGLQIKYSKSSYRKELSASSFEQQVNSASNQQDIDKMRGTLEAERPSMTSREYGQRLAAINAQEKITDQMEVDAVYDAIVSADPDSLLLPINSDENNPKSVVSQIRRGEVVQVEDGFGGVTSVDFGKMKPRNRDFLIQKIKAKQTNDKAEALSANLNAIDAEIAGKTLSELQQMEDNVTAKEGGKFLIGPEITDFSDRQKIKSLINAAIRDKAVLEIAKSQEVLRNTSAAIDASPDGTLSQAEQDQAAAAIKGLRDAEQFDQANKMEVEIEAMQLAGGDFKSIEFASAEQQTAIIEEARAGRNTEQGARRFEILTKRITNRNKELKDDFVGYYNRKKPEAPLTPSELINLQLKMGVSPQDVRVTSNDDLKNFTAQYNAEGNTSMDKARILGDFVGSFGPENENRVMRHLMNKNVISFAEHLRAAYPEQINMQTVVDGSLEENVKNFESKLTKDQRNVADGLVRDLVDDYASSVMGNVIDRTVGVGGDAGRTAHIIKMQDAIGNAAKHLMATRSIDAEEAVQIAYDTIIGNHFVFENINNKQMRVPIALEGRSKDIATVLKYSVFEDQDYLRERIIFPPTPEGKSEEDFQNQFLADLKNEGSWRTTVDNTGIFLVDQLGNLVPMKLVEDFTPPTPGVEGFGGFISVPFDSVLPLADQYRDMPEQLTTRLKKIFTSKKLF
jgi:hypothetical protein